MDSNLQLRDILEDCTRRFIATGLLRIINSAARGVSDLIWKPCASGSVSMNTESRSGRRKNAGCKTDRLLNKIQKHEPKSACM